MRPPLSYVPALFPLVGFIAGMLVCEMAGYLWIPVVIISGVALIVARRRLPVWTLPLGGMLLFCGLGGADMSCNFCRAGNGAERYLRFRKMTVGYTWL